MVFAAPYPARSFAALPCREGPAPATHPLIRVRKDKEKRMKAMTMGLDMYAYKTREAITAPVDFKVGVAEEIHYWRKHPDLHGWMEVLYREKDGLDGDFNVVNLALTSEDLDNLEKAIRGKGLPDTCGFFFGDSDGTEHDDDLDFVRKARLAIADGYSVFYTSWW